MGEREKEREREREREREERDRTKDCGRCYPVGLAAARARNNKKVTRKIIRGTTKV